MVSAGETLLLKNISKLLIAIKKKQVEGSMITNGYYLERDLASLLTKIKWDLIRISMNGSSREVYQQHY